MSESILSEYENLLYERLKSTSKMKRFKHFNWDFIISKAIDDLMEEIDDVTMVDILMDLVSDNEDFLSLDAHGETLEEVIYNALYGHFRRVSLETVFESDIEGT